MLPILTIDIGAGTTDILVFYPDSGIHYKAVALSPIRRIAGEIHALDEDLLITGTVMGGGAVSKAVIQHARSHKVSMTPEAARTINDDLEEVEEKGITIISEDEARDAKKDHTLKEIVFGDISVSGLQSLLGDLGVEWKFSFIAGAVQDHGVCPNGLNSLDFRHQVMKERIERNPSPEQFLFSYAKIPLYLTRMKTTGNILSQIPHEKLFMMDTGAAAIVGAFLDPGVKGCKHCIIADIGNSHTLAALMSESMIGGFFEYHTDSLTPNLMEALLVSLGNGGLDHKEIIASGGHGAFVRSCPGFDNIEKIVVTGPRRNEIMKGIGLEYIEGAPLGDNMMTGTAGLLESINRRERLGLNI